MIRASHTFGGCWPAFMFGLTLWPTGPGIYLAVWRFRLTLTWEKPLEES